MVFTLAIFMHMSMLHLNSLTFEMPSDSELVQLLPMRSRLCWSILLHHCSMPSSSSRVYLSVHRYACACIVHDTDYDCDDDDNRHIIYFNIIIFFCELLCIYWERFVIITAKNQIDAWTRMAMHCFDLK
jgi:hypothetical protein